MSPLRYQKWEVGVSLMRNGKILATGENVSLGT
ncbi:fimH domain protein, partial [Shigella dysenteriae]|nr:fimH domain protein [Shigella dysenteriae]